MTIEAASIIAERHITAVINGSERLRKYEFGPVKFWRETDRYWVFSAGSRQLMDEGYVPGAISACVDKLDGHVWSIKEQEQYAQSLSPIPPPPRPVSADGKVMMDVEDALSIARREISEIIKNSDELRGYEFEPVRLRRWTGPYWVFSAESPQLTEEGSEQGEIFVCVDPFDGHIWSLEEQGAHERSRSQIEQTTQPDLAAA
ncbi:MAG: hypothetical protein ACRD9Y_02560 [Blastocatellia bacterium]